MASSPAAELLARLVAFDSTSRNPNLPLAECLADVLDRPGIAVELLPGAEAGKASLLARVGPEVDPETRRGLLLSGHMDVVPADDRDRWTSDPFVLTDRGDRWVARGAADMKGFLALATRAAVAAAGGGAGNGVGGDADGAAGARALRHPLVLLFTYDEEVGCLGAEHLVRTWGAAPPLPRAAVIGEPTELRAIRVHKGHLKLRLDYRGVSAHSAYPHLGENAIAAATEGVRALGALADELAAERVDSSKHFPDAPYAALNVGTIHGGAAVNVVPDRCAIEVGIRLLPGMDAAKTVTRVRRAVGDGPELEVLSASPPMESPAGAEIFAALAELSGDHEPPGAVSFATDAGWLSRLGLDCAIWGPGSIEVAHKPDEWLPKADMERAEEVLGGLVVRFCGAGGGNENGEGGGSARP